MKNYKIAAIPLNRDPVISYLKNPSPQAKGAAVRVLGQRPAAGADIEWAERLSSSPSVDVLLRRDKPGSYLTETTTDRLIPVEYIREDDGYLTRNLGGWSPVYFGLMEADKAAWATDPLLGEADILATYGESIRYFGPDKNLVLSRLKKEFGITDISKLRYAFQRLLDWRVTYYFMRSAADAMNYADKLFRELITKVEKPPRKDLREVPRALLIDELIGQHVRIEEARRTFVATGNKRAADEIKVWQDTYREQHGISLILKGEYVMGRQRRSTVLIAEKLGFVAKQPGAEPFHEAMLNAKTYMGSSENWPVLTGDGAVVTPCGRIRLIVEQGLIIKLNRIFGHNITCISALGFIIEPFIAGPTLQEYLLENPSRLTEELYAYVLIHQLICEELGVENGDWHSANFIVLENEVSPAFPKLPKMIHIDWGAARPLEQNELSNPEKENRLNQVQNIAFSFHDENLASLVKSIHQRVTGNNGRMKDLRRTASKIVSNYREDS